MFSRKKISKKLFLRRKESDHGTGRFLFFTFMAGLYISNRPGRNDYLRRALRRGGIFYRPPVFPIRPIRESCWLFYFSA